MSTPPPGVYGTSSRTERAGHCCACAVALKPNAAVHTQIIAPASRMLLFTDALPVATVIIEHPQDSPLPLCAFP